MKFLTFVALATSAAAIKMHPNSQQMMQEQSIPAAKYQASDKLAPNASATGLLWPTPPNANPLKLGDKDGNGDIVTL